MKIAETIWSLCEEIGNKKNWYEKVFNDEIVSKWREEVPKKDGKDFDIVLGFMRASA